MRQTVTETESAPLSTSIEACRSCGSGRLHLIADLGSTPLANAFLAVDQLGEQELKFPLKLVFCAECTLVQITETVRPDILFERYLYASSYSETMLCHAREVCDKLCHEQSLGEHSLVVEIASNDGYLLQFLKERTIPVLGIEPAANIADIALSRGIPTRKSFFSSNVAEQLVDDSLCADVVIGNNVLAHVSTLNDFISGVKTILKPDGIARFEFPYLGDLIRNLEFDTIYHEHICYFSAHSIDALFRRHGLVLADVEHIPIHGGSLAVTAASSANSPVQSRVEQILAEERVSGIDQLSFYTDFGVRIAENLRELRSLTRNLRQAGFRLSAYGASAKGSTLLNTACLEPGTLEYVVDRSELKQGLFTPGTRLPILPPERLLQDRPDYVLLLTWNFLEEIVRQQKSYCDLGGKFIIPIPNPVIV